MEGNAETSSSAQTALQALSISDDSHCSKSECLAITYTENQTASPSLDHSGSKLPNPKDSGQLVALPPQGGADSMSELADMSSASCEDLVSVMPECLGSDDSLTMTGAEEAVLEGRDLASRAAAEAACGEGDVKSRAVVKFEACETQVQYSQLEVNTDLNVTPSNWLRNSSIPIPMPWRSCSYDHLKNFNIANKYLPLIGDVDVVADAETVKQLLKMPYNKGNYFISIIVHRFGNTLVIDQFDLHQHRRNPDEKQWQWFLKFVLDQVRSGEGSKSFIPRMHDHSREKLQEMNRLSKLWCQSAIPMPAPGAGWQDAGEVEAEAEVKGDVRETGMPLPAEMDEEGTLVEHHSMAVAMAVHALSKLPDPLPWPEKEKLTTFARDVVWTIDDSIKMLVGADLPIFGGETHPCLTLKLRNAEKPINVMTGIDIWLDNMMCNVPEVEMCFEINGIVQKYERIKTEDIPNLEGSQFNPADIINIMQNILLFLKRNATQEGHTYWLHQDKDVVKLWDLTALCPSEQLGYNPFLVPVGCLLYRMARQLRLKYGLQEEAAIRTLLERSIMLLEETDHVEALSSAYYLLADLYVPDCALRGLWSSVEDLPGGRNPSNPSPAQDKGESPRSRDRRHKWKHSQGRRSQEHFQTGPDHMPETVSTIPVMSLKTKPKDLFTLNSVPYRCGPIRGEQEKRCNTALRLITKSLRTLARKQTVDTTRPSTKALLLRKAAIVFYKQGMEITHMVKRFGHALRKVRLAVHCLEAMSKLEPEMRVENWEIQMLLLKLAGQVRCELLEAGMRSRVELDDHKRNFDDLGEDETFVLSRAQHVVLIPESSWTYEMSLDPTDNLDACLRCYEEALKIWERRSKRDATDFYATYNQEVQRGLSQAFYMMGSNVLSQAEKGLQQWSANEDLGTVQQQLLNLVQDALMALSKGLRHCQAACDIIGQANFHGHMARAFRIKFDIIYVQGIRSMSHPAPPTEEMCAIIDMAQREYMESVMLLKTLPDSQREVALHLWEVCATLSHLALVILTALPIGPEKEFPDRLIGRLRKTFDSIYCMCEQLGALSHVKSRHSVHGMTLLREVSMWKLMLMHKHLSLADLTDPEDKVAAMLDKAWKEFAEGEDPNGRLNVIKEELDWHLIRIKSCTGAEKRWSFRRVLERLTGCGECLGKCAKQEAVERDAAKELLSQVLGHASKAGMHLLKEVKAGTTSISSRQSMRCEQQLKELCHKLVELSQRVRSESKGNVFQEARQLLGDFENFKDCVSP